MHLACRSCLQELHMRSHVPSLLPCVGEERGRVHMRHVSAARARMRTSTPQQVDYGCWLLGPGGDHTVGGSLQAYAPLHAPAWYLPHSGHAPQLTAPVLQLLRPISCLCTSVAVALCSPLACAPAAMSTASRGMFARWRLRALACINALLGLWANRLPESGQRAFFFSRRL